MFDESGENDINESVKNNINEYYRLKSKYDTDNEKNKKKIINNKMLSIKEKKSEFKQLKPKCVNCGKPGGTTFASIVSKDNSGGKFRELRAFCKAVEPCGLNINIAVGNFENINGILKMIDSEIYTAKNEIINDKNKLLFGLITTENALENFDLQKATIKDYTSLLENYLQIYIKITDDPETKQKLDEELEKSYLLIHEIKLAIKNFNDTYDIQFVRGAMNIYNTNLKPLLNEILRLKYKENMVVFDESNNTYHLIQKKYSIQDLEMNNDKYETIVFDTSVQAALPSVRSDLKKRRLIADSSQTESSSELLSSSDIIGHPNINKANGTVTWSNKNYQNVWNKMSNELKTALSTDTEWLQEFMDNCVKARLTNKMKNGDEPLFIPAEKFTTYKDGYNFTTGKSGKGYYLQNKSCEFINPSNLIIPPQLIEDGMYDFGNQVYNDIFNKLDESYKTTLLTLFSVNPKDGSKNYSMLESTLADIVKKELKFDNRTL